MVINALYLEGNVVADCEVIELNGDPNIVKFTVAHNERRFNKDTNQYENGDTTYMDCSVYDASGKRTPYLQEDLVKGAHVVVEGRVHQDNWEKDGQKRSKITCRVDNVVARPPYKKDGGQQRQQSQQTRTAKSTQPAQQMPPATIGGDIFDSDIPFD